MRMPFTACNGDMTGWLEPRMLQLQCSKPLQWHQRGYHNDLPLHIYTQQSHQPTLKRRSISFGLMSHKIGTALAPALSTIFTYELAM